LYRAQECFALPRHSSVKLNHFVGHTFKFIAIQTFSNLVRSVIAE